MVLEEKKLLEQQVHTWAKMARATLVLFIASLT
jgi:hypothetical protein